jgi:CBS domain containing-hemolysin-like protein
VVRILGGDPSRTQQSISEAELRLYVEEHTDLEDEEKQLIAGVFDFGDRLVRHVMVPRPDMDCLSRDTPIRLALQQVRDAGYSCFPVFQENYDDIVGVVTLRDLLYHIMDHGPDDACVAELMKPAAFVPDTKNAGDLLREMQQERNHVAVVIDEYGGTAGIVTIEDILEEIVGEITDEYDRELPPVEDLGDGRFRVTSRLDIGDLGELYDVELDDEDVETVGGLLAKTLGRVPIPGASAIIGLAGDASAASGRPFALRLTAETPAGRRNRIGAVLVEPVPAPFPAEPEQ